MKIQRFKRRDLAAAGCLFFASLFFCWFFVARLGIFGSSIDWISQHSTIADYFRKRFYATGNLFPDFVWNLGGGQNIYNVAYYGLFSPQILLSYVVPFVKMDVWIMGSSAVLYAVSPVIFYGWLVKKRIKRTVCFGTAFLFALATPLVFHSYNQLMFVNYMPFLCLALLGVDRHFAKRKNGLLIGAIFAMILTSFYFSVGGLAAISMYAVVTWNEKREETFWKAAVSFALPVLTAIFLSGILLLPSAAALFGSSTGSTRSGASGGIGALLTDLSMWKPQISILRICYTPYGLGLSAFALAALCGRALGPGKIKDHLLSWMLFFFFCMPIFGYLLNGGLYSKDKVFLPFLPLVCMETAKYVENLERKEVHCGKKRFFWELWNLLPYGILLILMWQAKQETCFSKYWKMGMLDAGVVTGLYLLWRVCSHWKQMAKICLPLLGSLVILFGLGKEINAERNLMIPRETYENLTSEKIQKAVEDILAEDPLWYRIEQYGTGGENLANVNRIWNIGQNLSTIYASAYNGAYKTFRDQTYQINEAFRNRMMQTVSDDPLFWQLMGVKYVLAKKQPEGYTLYRDYGTFQVYQNEHAAPLAYVTDQVIPKSQYMQLSYPQNQEILASCSVIPDEVWETADTSPLFTSSFCEAVLQLPEQKREDLTIQKTEDGYEIKAKKSVTVEADIRAVHNRQIADDGVTPEISSLLAVTFSVENEKPKRDLFIRIEGQTNRLTGVNHTYANENTDFAYLVTKPKGETVSMRLGKGTYCLKNLQAWIGTGTCLEPKEGQNRQELQLQKGTTGQFGGDGIRAKVSTEKEGFLITSIPYDPHFTLKVDGKETRIFPVNTAFVGAEISAGKHEITLEYHAPGKKEGILCSVTGVILLAGLLGNEKKKKKK